MSTRGAIALETGEGKFEGTYHHWDSYPDGLGATLWELYHGHFKHDLKAMVDFLLEHHWSTINGCDFTLEPGYDEFKPSKNAEEFALEKEKAKRPQCYCHGDRDEEKWDVNEVNAADCGVEYAYAFDVENERMKVLSSYNPDGGKMIGMFGMGNPDASWRIIADVDLNGEEPDWDNL